MYYIEGSCIDYITAAFGIIILSWSTKFEPYVIVLFAHDGDKAGGQAK